ncbi:hypothetical protein quinque_014225 [Culex quinquefasciatus]
MASSGGGMYAFPPTLDPSWSLKGSSRYVTVQALNKGSLATVNIFLVTKSIRACATVEDIRKNFKAGTYTVRVPNEAQAKQLKDKLTVLGDQITKVEKCFEKSSMQIEYLTKELENKQHYITLLEQKVKTLTSNKMTPNEERRPMPTKRDRSSEAKKNDELDSDDSNRSRSPAPKTLAIETTTTSKDDLISLSETIYVEVESSSSMEFDPNSISPNS